MKVDQSATYDRPASVQPIDLRAGHAWLGIGLATGVAIYAAYLLSHPYPAYAGGLFLVMAEQVLANGYHLPTTIPYYAIDGVPFAYPPLQFYVTAAVHDLTGLPLVTIARYLPGLAVIAYLVPFYGIARQLLQTPQRAGVATVLFAVTPTTLRWHLSAGGIVRAPAMLFALTGIYIGLRLFRGRDRRWLAPAVVLFSLTALTHPTYAVFFGLSYLLLFAFFDRSVPGLLSGAAVAVGGLVLTAPWWLTVAARHGPEIFFIASGTHSGLGGGPVRLVSKLGYALVDLNVETGFYLAAYAGGLFALVRGRYLLPAWAVGSSYFIGKNRFMFVAGSMLATVLLFDFVIPRLEERIAHRRRRRLVTVGVVAVVVLGAAVLGVLYATSALGVAHEASPSQPQTLDDHDLDAMDWIQRNTAPDAPFVVLGDQGEWLPLLAERPIQLGPWGWEWKATASYYGELERYDAMATCQTAPCLSSRLDRSGRAPVYVYVPMESFTVRGKQYHRDPGLRRSMIRSDRYELVYENPGVLVFRVRGGSAVPTAA